MDLLNKFVRLINRREELISIRYGNNENLRQALNFQEEREWYAENIVRLDRKIIIVARNILPDEKFEKISDVYLNEFLFNKYKKFKEDKVFNR